MDSTIEIRFMLDAFTRVRRRDICFSILFSFAPGTRHLIRFTFTNRAISEGAHAVVGPQGALAKKISFKVTEKWCLNELFQEMLHGIAIDALYSGVAAATVGNNGTF